MFALLAYVIAIIFVLCIQARDIRKTKAENLGINTEILGVETSLELAEALLELGW